MPGWWKRMTGSRIENSMAAGLIIYIYSDGGSFLSLPKLLPPASPKLSY